MAYIERGGAMTLSHIKKHRKMCDEFDEFFENFKLLKEIGTRSWPDFNEKIIKRCIELMGDEYDPDKPLMFRDTRVTLIRLYCEMFNKR